MVVYMVSVHDALDCTLATNKLNEASKQDTVSSNGGSCNQKGRQQSVLEKLEVSCCTGVKLKQYSYLKMKKHFDSFSKS